MDLCFAGKGENKNVTDGLVAYVSTIGKFNPKTFKPFDKVLVWDAGAMSTWRIELFARFQGRHATCLGSSMWDYCIPYNEETRMLQGTGLDCPDFYKWWLRGTKV